MWHALVFDREVAVEDRISVIIPTLNEAQRIEQCLREVTSMEKFHEVIVVDGRSTDDTVARVRSFPGVCLLEGERGRGVQMNLGAADATGDVLLFLHADVSLPLDALRWIREVMADESVVAGAFRTWTVTDQGSAWFTPLLHIADLRSRYSSLPYGDQALFVRTAAFEAVGGFPEIALMEDLELSRQLRKLGRIRMARASVKVSGRRFLARPLYYFALTNTLPLLFRLGIPTERLARLYGAPR